MVAVSGLGAGVLLAELCSKLEVSWAPILSLLVLWGGLIGSVAYALTRSRPAGLLAFRSRDILLGVSLGIALRAAQGVINGANTATFPRGQTAADASSYLAWCVSQLWTAGVVGPVVEEFYFRALLIVTIFQLFRRSLGHASAGLTAILFSSGAFVCLHGLMGQITLPDGLALFALSATCSVLVLLTGRIWSAVVLHITYNTIFLGLTLVGYLMR